MKKYRFTKMILNVKHPLDENIRGFDKNFIIISIKPDNDFFENMRRQMLRVSMGDKLI